MTGPVLIVDNVGSARGGRGGCLAVCVASLEGVGRLTSLFGSEAAGAATLEYAARLEEVLRPEDQIIAINEGKHCLLVRGLRDRSHAMLAGMKIERLFERPFNYRGMDITLTVRAGIACGESDESDAEDLFRAAEAAREGARAAQKIYQVADDGAVSMLHQRWKLNDQIEDAIRQHRLKVYYQPKVSARERHLAGAEGLVRWEHEDGLLGPGQFLPHLDTERMLALTTHVVRQAVRDLAAGSWMPPVSVNLEPYMLSDSGLLRLILDELAMWSVDPRRLIVEVTENGLMATLDDLCPEYHELRARGVRVAMDDFGTGHSSLAQFRNLPLDELKIERSFITHLDSDEANRYLTRTMIDLAHFFGRSVVAEGVETERVADALERFDCDLLQGFLFAPPLPLPEFSRWAMAPGKPPDSA